MILCLLSIWISAYPPNEIALRVEETWRHDKVFGGVRFGTLVDPDGALIGQFQMDPPFLITSESITELRPMGQGPGDLISAFGVGLRGEDLVVVEHSGKIKVFSKQKGTYAYKESIHRKAGVSAYMIEDFTWVGERFFIAGYTLEPTDEKDRFTLVEVKAYDHRGTFLGNPIEETGESADFQTRNTWIERHLKTDGHALYFMTEQSLELRVIDPLTATVTDRLRLERPPFYVPIAEDAYRLNEDNGRKLRGPEIMMKLPEWRKSYSAVENIEITKDYMVVQLRTARDHLKRFALCYYTRGGGYVLRGLTYTDDFLVGSSGGRLYLMEGGHPGIDDDEPNQTIIHIVTPNLP